MDRLPRFPFVFVHGKRKKKEKKSGERNAADPSTLRHVGTRDVHDIPVITRPCIDPPPSVPPTIQQFSFTKLPMNAGEFANLQCIVPTGDLPLNIRWSYPGEEMGGSSGVLAKKVADRVSMLMISVIAARHAGEYVCTAENAAGTASHSTTLTVNGSGLLSAPRNMSSSFFFYLYIHVYTYIHIYIYMYTFIFRFLHNSGKKQHRSEKASPLPSTPFPVSSKRNSLLSRDDVE